MDETTQPHQTLADMTPAQRDTAMRRFGILRPILEDGVTVRAVAGAAGISPRTLERWLARYRAKGLPGLARKVRDNAGHRRTAPEIVALIEALALRRPKPAIAAIYRRVCVVAVKHDWTVPSASTVRAIVRELDPGMVVLATEGAAAYRDRFELIHRHRADAPNALWQADHTQLDIRALDANGTPVRPWLTAVMDDHSRAIAGYSVFTGAPSAMQTALALRQAIWRKSQAAWAVCGIPDALYVDHGSDFTSTHLQQVAVDLRFRLVFSTVARPQGRGKIERFFGTINTELLSGLPGYLTGHSSAPPPLLSLTDLDAAIGCFVVQRYNARRHRETGTAPVTAWLADGWLPRMPDRIEDLDELLVMVAKTRMVQRDGIHFQGLRYLDPTLAAYVGEAVTIRFDPRDMAEIRVFHRNRFLCRAINPDHADHSISLKDVQAARNRRRKALRKQIRERIGRVSGMADCTPAHEAGRTENTSRRRTPRLRTYRTGD